MARKFSFKTYSKIRYELIKAKKRKLKTEVVLENGKVGLFQFKSVIRKNMFFDRNIIRLVLQWQSKVK